MSRGLRDPAWHRLVVHPGVALPCRSQSWQVAGVFTPMGNSYPVPSPYFTLLGGTKRLLRTCLKC